MNRAAIIYNPTARNAPPRERLLAKAGELHASGWEVRVLVTEGAGHGTELARVEAASGAAAVLACGGDGTVNEVINGLAGSATSFAVIRGGMGDVFAKEIGVPRNPEAALNVLVDGEERVFDLGRAGERYFLAMCGVGFDASVVRAVPSAAKRRLGSTSYVLWGLRELLAYRPVPASVSLDGEQVAGDLFWLLMGNTRSYGGVLNITSKAKADDGRLDAYVFTGRGAAWLAATTARFLTRRLEEERGAVFRRALEISVDAPGLPVQGDGEYFGQTPMKFSAEAGALRVLTPRGGSRALFGES